jgi:hypothetical protein
MAGKAAWKFLKTAQIVVLVIGGLAILAGGSSRIIGAVFIVAVFLSYVAVGARRPRKRCPQCSEAVMAEAHVCKHCGHSFAV